MDEEIYMDSLFSIKFISNNYVPKKHHKDRIVVFSIMGVAILVIIGIAIFLFYKNTKKKEDLNKDINAISFLREREDSEN